MEKIRTHIGVDPVENSFTPHINFVKLIYKNNTINFMCGV